MAVTKKSTKPSAPKKRTTRVSFDFSAWRRNFKKSWQKNPSLYTLGTTFIVVIIALGLLFWFQRSLFLAGIINGRLITTPQFYSKLAKSGGEEVFQSLVQDTLIKQEAAKKGVSVSEKEINQAAVGLTKEQVKQTLRSQKLSQEFGRWFEEVKKKAKITTYF